MQLVLPRKSCANGFEKQCSTNHWRFWLFHTRFGTGHYPDSSVNLQADDDKRSDESSCMNASTAAKLGTTLALLNWPTTGLVDFGRPPPQEHRDVFSDSREKEHQGMLVR